MEKSSRTFSYRAFVIGVAAMIVMGIWVHFHEVLVPDFKELAENSPPAGAVGVFVGLLLVGGLLARFRNKLRLAVGELIVIYSMLVIAAPLMSQGMWHRFLGLVIAIPETADNLPLVDSYSEKLWPHGEHLVPNRRFEEGLGSHCSAEPSGQVKVVPIENSQVGRTSGVQLHNPAAEGSDDQLPETTLRIRIPRHRDGQEILVPGERYYVTALFRLSGFLSRSGLTVELVTDCGELEPITTLRSDTKEKYTQPGGFKRAGQTFVTLPRELKEYADIVFTLQGAGTATITDVICFSNEAMARLRKGTSEVRESDYAELADNDRDSLLVRPDSLASPAGLWYTLKGYVPYRQWITPLLYWVSIVMAMFLCLLGIGVIFRKQWAENERFSFPMVVIPRLLLEESEEGGVKFRPIFRKATFKIGVTVALVYALLQGLAYYVPGMPNPTIDVKLSDYFSSPAMKVFINGFYRGDLKVVLLFMSIAFFVDLDMLLSILIFFWLAKVPFLFGEWRGWKTIKGPLDNFPFPHEQHIGAFLSLALIVIITSRRHLMGVVRRICGLPGGADDSREAMSYRGAMLLILASFVFFGVWGSWSGLGAGNSVLFFGFLVVCGLSASRIRTECGAPSTYFTPYFPYLIFFLLGGLFVFKTQTFVLAYAAGGFMAVAQFLLFAPTQVEMLHLADTQKAKPKGMKWALIVGALGGILIGGYVMLVWAYGRGGDNIRYMKAWGIQQNWYFRSLRYAAAAADGEVLQAGERRADLAKRLTKLRVNESAAKEALRITDREALQSRLAQLGVAEAQSKAIAEEAEEARPKPKFHKGPLCGVATGSAITLLLAFLRTRFVGFWLHPIGYILANTYFIYGCWGAILAAWIVKWIGLKIGGPRVIREHMTPFFGGVFVGCLFGMALWDVCAVVAMSQGVRDVFTCLP